MSTHLYRDRRLQRDHLQEIASHGFETVEVVAAGGHFDAANPAAVADLQQWLAEARLELGAVALPPAAAIGSPDDPGGAAELAALHVARRIPVKVLVAPVGGPAREAARFIERLAAAAAPLGVAVAVDSRSPSMTPLGSLVHFVEDGVDARVGIALDLARAGQSGDPSEAIELVSEHLLAVRVPLDGRVDWPTAMTTLQKVGYDGPLTFDAEAAGSVRDTLGRARKAREKMEQWLTSI